MPSCVAKPSQLFVCDPVAEMAVFLLSSVRPGFLFYQYSVAKFLKELIFFNS